MSISWEDIPWKSGSTRIMCTQPLTKCLDHGNYPTKAKSYDDDENNNEHHLENTSS